MEAVEAPWSGQSGWHVARWGPLGWAESIVKLVGIAVAVGAAIDEGEFSVADTHRLSYWLLVVIAVGYLGTVFDRLTDRELVAMGFVVLMVLGHWAAVYAVGRDDWPTGTVRTFAAAMLLGDLIKLVYFSTTKASVRGLPWTVPLAMTATLAVAYLVVLIGS